jgi:hypothetical protein
MRSSAKLKFLADKESVTWRQSLFIFLEDETSSQLSYAFSTFITVTILASIVTVLFETMDGPNHYSANRDPATARYPFLASKTTYDILEIIFTVIFTGELILRMISATSLIFKPAPIDVGEGRQIIDASTPFFKSLMNWADIAAVAPFYILILAGSPDDLDYLTGLAKAARSLRIFKLSRQFEGSEVLGVAVANR